MPSSSSRLIGLWLLPAILFGCAASAGESAPPPIPAPVLLKSFDAGEGMYRGSPVVADLDGDGQPEIVVAPWSEVQVWSVSGKKLHGLKVNGRVYSGAVVGDLFGDKHLEIVAGDNQGNVHAWRADGTPVPGFPQKVESSADIRQIACADLDGDGKDEIVAYSNLTDHGCLPNMYVFQNDGTIRKGWPHFHKDDKYLGQHFDHAGGFNNCLAVGDLDGDRKLDLIFPQDYGSICVFHDDGTPFEAKGQEVPDKKGPVWWGECRAWEPFTCEKIKWGPGKTHLLEFTYSPPLIADLDLDGHPEILCVANTEDPAKIGPITGSCLIVRNMDFTPKAGFTPWKRSGKALSGEGTGSKFEANPCVVAGDIAGDARLEVIVVHLDGVVHAYGPDGADLWKVEAATSNTQVVTEPLLADLDGDGKAEVLVTVSDSAAKSGKLLVLDGAGRTRLEFPLPFHSQAAPTLADLNGDGVPELIFNAFNKGSGKDSVFVYAWPCVNPKGLQWPTGRGNFGHTACVQKPPPSQALAAKKVEKAEQPSASPLAPKIDPKLLAPWNAKLTEWVAQCVQNGARPQAFLRVMGERAERVKVVGADAKALVVEVQGNKLPLQWDKLGGLERLSLAQAFLKEDDAGSCALAAVFALAGERTDLAAELFAKAQAADPKGGAALVTKARNDLGLK
ncbi:MAG: VCBS repeat-containing protein [Planctomycetes bacterium]|nr:VCBS repeat-containing protein [Planctomycetota bacterium]